MPETGRSGGRILAVGLTVVAVLVAVAVLVVTLGRDGGEAPDAPAAGVSSGPSTDGPSGPSTKPSPEHGGEHGAQGSGSSGKGSAKGSGKGGSGRGTGAAAEADRPRSKPVRLTQPSSAGTGMVVRITKVERVRGKSVLPGEVGGPALRVTVSAANRGTKPFTLSAPVVNLYYGFAHKPAQPLTQPGAKPFPGRIAPGSTATGVFVFQAPQRQGLTVEVEADLDPDLRIVTFRGVPRAS